MYASVFRVTVLAIALGALIAYLSFVLSASNPFGISIQNFLPFLYSRLIIEEICPFVAFMAVLGQTCITTGMELHNCARRGELEILQIYRVNPVGIYLSPFIVASMLLGTLACGGFIIASFAVIFWMVYLSGPGYFSINVERYWNIVQAESISLVFFKTISFLLLSSLTASYYAVDSYTKTEKFKVSNVIAISMLLSIATDFLFLLFNHD
ncbi:MAG: ABC transporter permease [Planctomycetota bacterium]